MLARGGPFAPLRARGLASLAHHHRSSPRASSPDPPDMLARGGPSPRSARVGSLRSLTIIDLVPRQPFECHSHEGDLLVRRPISAFEEQSDRAVRQDDQARIGRRTLVHDTRHWPGRALVFAHANRHALPPRAGRIAEQQPVAAVRGRRRQAKEAGLGGRLDERAVRLRLRPRPTPVIARGDHPEVLRPGRMVTHVQHQPPVGQLDDLALVGARVGAAADLPAAPAVVAEHDV